MLIKIKDGFKLDGEGTGIGKDGNGRSWTFWRSSGHMDVPADLAIRLELERPQRFEIVDRTFAATLTSNAPKMTSTVAPLATPKPIQAKPVEQLLPAPPVKPALPSFQEFKAMTKDKLLDFAAINEINVNYRQRKADIIQLIIKTCEKRYGLNIK